MSEELVYRVESRFYRGRWLPKRFRKVTSYILHDHMTWADAYEAAEVEMENGAFAALIECEDGTLTTFGDVKVTQVASGP